MQFRSAAPRLTSSQTAYRMSTPTSIGCRGMHKIQIGDVSIACIIERDGPWRLPENLFPTCDPALARRHLAEMEPFLWDPASGKLVMPYQTFVVRTPRHTVLIDTCTGEDKNYGPPWDF